EEVTDHGPFPFNELFPDGHLVFGNDRSWSKPVEPVVHAEPNNIVLRVVVEEHQVRWKGWRGSQDSRDDDAVARKFDKQIFGLERPIRQERPFHAATYRIASIDFGTASIGE